MRLKHLKEVKHTEELVPFHEDLLRRIAKDRDVDLSHESTEDLRKIHDRILQYAQENLEERGYGMEDIGQEYYDVAKSYFLN